MLREARHDFGRVLQGATLEHAFAIVNRGDRPLAVRGVVEVLGCTGQPEPAALEPGQAGRLRVRCRASLFGPLQVSLRVLSNDPSAPPPELEVRAEVTPLLTFDRALLEARLAPGERQTLTFGLVGAMAAQAQLELEPEESSGCEFTLPVSNGAAPGPRRIDVHALRVGMHVGSLRFRTGLADPARVELGYSCQVPGNLQVTPTNPYFDLRAPGPKQVVLGVSSRVAGFVLRRAEVLEGPFAASIERAEAPGHYRVVVRVVAEQLGDGRGVNGTLRLHSNDRAEPVRDVPLFGFGRLVGTGP